MEELTPIRSSRADRIREKNSFTTSATSCTWHSTPIALVAWWEEKERRGRGEEGERGGGGEGREGERREGEREGREDVRGREGREGREGRKFSDKTNRDLVAYH